MIIKRRVFDRCSDDPIIVVEEDKGSVELDVEVDEQPLIKA
jgi:hypothetical protein